MQAQWLHQPPKGPGKSYDLTSQVNTSEPRINLTVQRKSLKFWISTTNILKPGKQSWTLWSRDVGRSCKRALWLIPCFILQAYFTGKTHLQNICAWVILNVPCTCIDETSYAVKLPLFFIICLSYLPFGSTAKRLASISFVLFASSSLSSNENSFWKLKATSGLQNCGCLYYKSNKPKT